MNKDWVTRIDGCCYWCGIMCPPSRSRYCEQVQLVCCVRGIGVSRGRAALTVADLCPPRREPVGEGYGVTTTRCIAVARPRGRAE